MKKLAHQFILNKKIVYLFVTLLIGGVIGCKEKERMVKIGAIQPMTGYVASWGQHGERAFAIAVDEINQSGGINGKKLKLILEDSKGDPKVGADALNKLIDVDHIQFVLGDAISSVSFSTAPIAAKRHIVLLAVGSTAARLTDEGGDFFFRVMPSDAIQSQITARWMKDLGYEKIAVIGANNTWGSGLVEHFEKHYPDSVCKVVFKEFVDDKQTNFRTSIEKMKFVKPQAIYAPLYQAQAGLFLKQLKEMGVSTQVFGADVYEAPELLQTAGNAAEGVLFTTFVQKENDISRKFLAKYRSTYNIDPINYAYFAYDAIKIAATVLKTNVYEGDSLRTALLKLSDFSGATGKTQYDIHGDVTTKSFEKMVIHDGKIVPWEK